MHRIHRLPARGVNEIHPKDSAGAFVLSLTTKKEEEEHILPGMDNQSQFTNILRGERDTHRPMRPKPLIPTLIDMFICVLFQSFLSVGNNRMMTSDEQDRMVVWYYCVMLYAKNAKKRC